MKCLFEGCGVAIVTPFKNNQVDYASFYKIINSNIKKGAKAIIVLGTTGEGVSVVGQERADVIKFAKNIIGNNAKLIVGTGNNNFITCQENTIQAKSLGADGVLVVTPYYNKTTQKGLFEYYTQLSKIGIPIIVYNVPSRTGLNIDVETVEKLLDNDMIYGIKESTCDINRIIKLCDVCNDKIAVYSGEDALNYVFYCLGAKGCVSVSANVVADKVQKVYDMVKSGNIKGALEIQNSLNELNHTMFVETNPIPVKTLMAEMNLIAEDVRMPLVKAENETVSLIVKLAKKINKEKDFSL